MSTNTKRHKRGRERERENSIENHAKKRRGKIGLSGPFFALRVWWCSECRGISLPSRRLSTPRERATRLKSTHSRAEILSERRERYHSRVCFSQRRPFKRASFGSLSKGERKRGLKKAGLEFQSSFCARANTRDANEKNKFSSAYLLASIDVRV